MFPRSVFAALVLITASLIFPANAARRSPNVVFILTDNQGAWTPGRYGKRDIRTPHMDRLAAEGIRFYAHTETQRALAYKLTEFFQHRADPQYDMWKTGRSKAGALK